MTFPVQTAQVSNWVKLRSCLAREVCTNTGFVTFRTRLDMRLAGAPKLGGATAWDTARGVAMRPESCHGSKYCDEHQPIQPLKWVLKCVLNSPKTPQNGIPFALTHSHVCKSVELLASSKCPRLLTKRAVQHRKHFLLGDQLHCSTFRRLHCLLPAVDSQLMIFFPIHKGACSGIGANEGKPLRLRCSFQGCSGVCH